MPSQNVADILIEALPYIRQFAGSTIVVKYGGHAMVDEQLKMDFARDITLLKYIGINPVVVHGGGPQINEVMDRMGIKTQFVRGMRLTDADTMDVVEMVLGGKVNKSIVAQIAQAGGRAVGITGKDGGMVSARKMTIMKEGVGDAPPEIIDPGLVGEVTHVNPDILKTLTDRGFIPVVAPVGVGENGETYNINADVVACRIAAALGAFRLILLTDVDGVLDRDKKLIHSIDTGEVRRMISDESIVGGMIPKLEYALSALSGGVGKCHIINGTRRHSLLLELFTDQGIGTEVLL
ncbi:acetylglutamate kinase [Desulfobotulus mexicanus]|uniref:Acetylglutamate kinase n=1 Tax=Desulfobotulus mexicanus TaxID=2586642 RepID=A0A5S5MD95_9BACT|nr:acetylglutamate kinase [Desulfobotulus mexicanus]TYT73684.1 acetylglutamate kinase [Desulfobotulus mexicanus]